MVKRHSPLRPSAADSGLKTHTFLFRLVANQRFLAIILLTFLVIIIFPLARTYSQRRLVEQEIEDIQKQIGDYEGQNQELQSLLAYLQSDQSLEEQARLNLNLKKPGEAVVVIKNEPARAGSNEETARLDESNLAKWRHYFFP